MKPAAGLDQITFILFAMAIRSFIPRALVPQTLRVVHYLPRVEVARLAAACRGRSRIRD